MKKSAFMGWFLKQFPDPCTEMDVLSLQKEFDDLLYSLKITKRKLKEKKLWIIKEDAALKAWMVKK